MFFVFFFKAHFGGKAESGGREESGKRGFGRALYPSWDGTGWAGDGGYLVELDNWQ